MRVPAAAAAALLAAGGAAAGGACADAPAPDRALPWACRRVEAKGMVGTEDIALWQDGVAIVGSGDLGAALMHGDFTPDGDTAGRADPGEFWSVDLKAANPEPTRIPTSGIPQDIGTLPIYHGIYVSNATARLYAISHGFKYGGERILIFDILEPLALRYVRSISHRSFPNCGMNDVVEGVGNELYVSQFMASPGMPLDGPAHGRGGAAFGRKGGAFLHRCTWPRDDDASAATCSVVADGFATHPNGITITPDRSQLFVSEPFGAGHDDTGKVRGGLVHVFNRGADGRLTVPAMQAEARILNPAGQDNIELDAATGELQMGSFPDNVMQHFGMLLQVPDMKGQKKVCKENSVGGRFTTLSRDAWHRPDSWHYSEVHHDADGLMCFWSAAVRYGGRMIAGSPFDDGIVICDM